MTDIILHHFDISPFAEKIRLAFGIKGLSWRSVEIPLVMPKPDLTALTGGYRKTPVMQIGADIYCDTQRIALELEARFPAPTLFPGQSRALSFAFAQWSDAAFFQPGSGLSLGTNTALPEDIQTDRREFFSYMDFDTLEEQLPHLFSQFCAHLHLLEDMLATDTSWISGDNAGWLDILGYFPVWMCQSNIAGSDAMLAPLPKLRSWLQRMAAIGHGQRSEMDAEEALAIARSNTSSTPADIADDAWPRELKAGSLVTVTPADYGAVPVTGALLRLTHNDIAIARTDERAGDVVVHFPRAGYRVDPQ
ncbi:MAG: glutathione S-transferase [Halieaceae bacterium]